MWATCLHLYLGEMRTHHRLIFPAVLSLWVLLLLGLARVDKTPHPGQLSAPGPLESSLVRHQKLVEFLDQIVLQEQYYHSLHGQYTRLLNRLRLGPSEELLREYEFFVTKADRSGLEVIASSERVDGREERISIDQDYGVQANFALPPPRPEWLRLQAARVIRQAFYGGLTTVPSEAGVFQGYFRYESKQQKPKLILTAVGIKAPVLGQRVSLEDANGLVALQTMGENHEVKSSSGAGFTEVLLAQKIHWGEKGRYGQSIDELRPYLSGSLLSLLADPVQESEFQRVILAASHTLRDGGRLASSPESSASNDRRPASDGLLIEPISEELEIEKINTP